MALTRERAEGIYCAYFPFALWTEASLMRRYHNNLLVATAAVAAITTLVLTATATAVAAAATAL